MIETAEASDLGSGSCMGDLERMVDKEIGPAAIKMAREGKGAAAQRYPAQIRDKTGFHAM